MDWSKRNGSSIRSYLRNRHWDERARAQRRKSTQSNTVAENADIFSAFMPEKEGSGNGRD